MSKQWLNFLEQARLLIEERHLHADINVLANKLAHVNYYRLSGYFYFLYESDLNGKKIDIFRSGITFDLIWKYYLFDRRLRLLIIDAIERIETSFKTSIAYYWGQAEGATPHEHIKDSKLLSIIQKAYKDSKEDWAKYHRTNTPNVKKLYIWICCELWTFGNIPFILKEINIDVKTKISKNFNISTSDFFMSIISLLCIARNMSAHHSRIWNRKWQYKHKNKRKENFIDIEGNNWNLVWNGRTQSWEYQNIKNIDNSKKIQVSSTAFLLMVCQFLLKQIAPQSQWKQRLYDLLNHPDTPRNVITEMGFVGEWKNHPIWKD